MRTGTTTNIAGKMPGARPRSTGRLLAAFVLTAALMLANVGPATAALSGDVAGSTYEPAVSALRQIGIVGSEWAVSLQPSALLTRAEEARLLSRALTGESARSFLPLHFPDVSEDSWSKPYIDTAVLLKLMPGQANAAFNPNGKIARGQYAIDVLRLCGYHPADTAAAMALALKLGLVDSDAPSSYAYITRGDAITMAYRAFFGVNNPELGSTLARRVHGSRLRPAPAGERVPTLELHFLPGAGATLVRLPSGADWLINTGSPATLPSLFAYLGRLGVDRLDALIITDARLSPVGAVAAVTDRLSLASTVRLDGGSGTPAFPASLLAQDKDIKVDLISRSAGLGRTDSYTALRISRGTLRTLLGGGLNEAGERLLAGQDKAKLAADIWLPARLGPYEQHDFSFLIAVGPSYVVGTDAGDPDTASFYEGLAAAGAEVLTPDADGVIRLAIGSRSVSVLQPQPEQ